MPHERLIVTITTADLKRLESLTDEMNRQQLEESGPAAEPHTIERVAYFVFAKALWAETEARRHREEEAVAS